MLAFLDGKHILASMVASMRHQMAEENDPSGGVVGRAKGGLARAEALSAEKRQEIARKAATARWSKDMLHATHEGPVRIGDAVIQAANLSDGRRVLSQGQFLQAI